ncbi:hypothetical protein PSTG_19333 [Puccinia striiformis f. sp. tritici PST-78]|uniref:HTH araC/xylS-type domain-containing protein n=1 Tax=Puccinia striiformis f. sp. tritici PST-78 TaxID=1165861 RepID=A0A0L0UJT7_9BASI|nr:hypothetical protein PSTG_19333 [Puccinia striiformis f. sp. tritici PST-78]
MLPRDRRLAHWLEKLDGCDELPGLAKLAQKLNLQAKTLTRIFQRESGLSYQQWSQQWRLMRAIELLAEMPSFTGTTPKRFMKGDEREETGVGTHAGGE